MLNNIGTYLLAQSWQIGVIFAVVAAASFAMRRASAHWRYLLWVVVLVKCFVPPLVSVPLAVLPESVPAPVIEIAATAGPLTAPLSQVSVPQPMEFSQVAPVASKSTAGLSAVPAAAVQTSKLSWPGSLPATHWLTVAWAAGLGLFGLYVLVKAHRVRRTLNMLRDEPSEQLQAEVAELAGCMGMARVPRVWLVKGWGQPFVWGLLRGEVYLPLHFAQPDESGKRRQIIAHELAHIARFDAAVNALQVIAQGLFFFHPLVWWANKRIRAEREKCCDEMAIAHLSSSPRHYGSAIVDALVRQNETKLATPSLAIAGPVKNVEDRIKTILTHGRKFYRRPTLAAVVTVLILAGLCVPTALVLTARPADAAPKKLVVTEDVSSGIAVISTTVEEAIPALGERFIATLTNGDTVELVGIADLHGETKTWWRPDGSELTKPPYRGAENPPARYLNEIVVRYSGPSDASSMWKTPNSHTSGIGKPKDESGKQIDDLRVQLAKFVDSPSVVNFRFGVATGQWQTLVSRTTSGRTIFPDKQQPDQIIISGPDTENDKVVIRVATKVLEPKTRFVAFKTSGEIATPVTSSSESNGQLGLQTYRFKLPLEEIDHFEFQSRPYEWVQFKNVSLKPGLKTNVQVSTETIETAPAETPAAKATSKSGKTFTTADLPDVDRREVNKELSEFPAEIDLSTPEGAWAAWQRAYANGDSQAIVNLCWTTFNKKKFIKLEQESYDRMDPKQREVRKEAYLNSRLIEVIVFPEHPKAQSIAMAFYELRPPNGKPYYDSRYFGKIHDQWKNTGQDGIGDLDRARMVFYRKMSGMNVLLKEKGNRHLLDNPHLVRQAAKDLFERIRNADYATYLDGGKKDGRKDEQNRFPTVGFYETMSGHDVLVEWICREFSANPITAVEIGEVFKGSNGRPTVPYKVTLKDGKVLSGNLPFAADRENIYGLHGIDWQHQYPNGLSDLKATAKPSVSSDQVIVEDLALAMMVAIREKDDAALQAMSTDRIKGWKKSWPHFSMELRERFKQMTGKEIAMYPAESIVRGDVAAVKCTGPDKLNGIYLALFFVKTDAGWKNFTVRNAPPSMALESLLTKTAKAIGVELATAAPAASMVFASPLSEAAASPVPAVVKTFPAAFSDDVNPRLNRITVTFNKRMTDKSWSWVGGDDIYNASAGKIRYNSSRTTCTMPVKLKPGTVYYVGVNSPKFKNFKSADGRPAKPYVILFATKSKDGKPTLITKELVDKAVEVNSYQPAYDAAKVPTEFVAVPKVVKTFPPAFATDVDPKLSKITTTFDKRMRNGSWSWTGGGDTFPKTTGKASYDPSRTTCTMPVKLEPGKVYWIGVNSPSHKNFKSADGTPAKRYVILFSTKSANGKPTPLPKDMVEKARRINSPAKPAMRSIK